MAENVNQYEAMFLVGPMGAAEPENALNMCRGIIERHGGQIILIKKWDERKLAYELEGQKRGTYIISYFRSPGSAVAGIERDVRLSEEILRVLVTRADHLNEQEMAAVEPQPIQQREERSYDRMGMGGEGGERGGYRGDRGDRPPRPRREEAPEPAKE
jgi:small subunit ribosomal protein S6